MNLKSFYHLNVTQMAIMTAISRCYHMLFSLPSHNFYWIVRMAKNNNSSNYSAGCSVVNHRKWQPNQESDWVNSYSVFSYSRVCECMCVSSAPLETRWPFAFNSFWCCCHAVSMDLFLRVAAFVAQLRVCSVATSKGVLANLIAS